MWGCCVSQLYNKLIFSLFRGFVEIGFCDIIFMLKNYIFLLLEYLRVCIDCSGCEDRAVDFLLSMLCMD